MEITDIEILEEEKLVKVSLKGRMISVQANRIYQKFLDEHLEKGIVNVLLDLSALDFLNSSGVGAIIISLKKINEAGGKIAICGCQARVTEVFTVTRMQKKIGLCKTEAEAMKYLKM